MANPVEMFPVQGIGEVVSGDDVAGLLWEAITAGPITIADGDIIVITHKIVSKAEGRVVSAATEEDSRRAVIDEAAAIVRRRGDLVIAQTRHGFICANAGVDRSNVEGAWARPAYVPGDKLPWQIRCRFSDRRRRRRWRLPRQVPRCPEARVDIVQR